MRIVQHQKKYGSMEKDRFHVQEQFALEMKDEAMGTACVVSELWLERACQQKRLVHSAKFDGGDSDDRRCPPDDP